MRSLNSSRKEGEGPYPDFDETPIEDLPHNLCKMLMAAIKSDEKVSTATF